MFSVIGTTATTRTGALSRAMADIAQITAAPPDMSSFILSMLSAGLIEMPPVSNVMPLPTRPSTTPGTAFGGSCREHDETRRLLAAARDAEQHAHLQRGDPLSRRALRHASPASLAIACARSANTRGVSSLPGSLASVRASLLMSPSTRPRSSASRTAGPSLETRACAASIHDGGCPPVR